MDRLPLASEPLSSFLPPTEHINRDRTPACGGSVVGFGGFNPLLRTRGVERQHAGGMIHLLAMKLYEQTDTQGVSHQLDRL
jgi:hypothetical protein